MAMAARDSTTARPRKSPRRPAPAVLAARGEPAEERDREQRERGRDQHHRRRPRAGDAIREVRDRPGYLKSAAPAFA